ncbi:MAG: 16S rRNA (guanine(966)-N(2))-methyltransferase RsmD [Gammaproteobacteria bacterium]|nr:16S rRNA (guanine(966)-N(2))-methyltransferase RsmD [Gammaproteobacteria bacterium]
MLNHRVRIVSGRFKGHRLKLIDQKRLRPTSDRVRETLFNWIGSRITSMRVLDLFAGSGALGFEALSRGAPNVTFIEKQAKIASQIKDTCHRLNLSAQEAEVICRNCVPWLKQDEQIWDLVFVDPPFADSNLYTKILHELQTHVSQFGLIYLEHSKRTPIDTNPYSVWKVATVGEVQFSLLSLDSGTSKQSAC